MLASLSVTASYTSHYTLAATTDVVAVYDVTATSHCLQASGHQTTSRPCVPGSVIEARVTSMQTALTRNWGYVVPAGSDQRTQASLENLANALHAKLAPRTATPNGPCGNGSNTYNTGSYSVYSDFETVYYRVNYTVQPDCYLSAIKDRNQVSNGSGIYGNMFWKKSCVPSSQSPDSNCTPRNCIAIPFQPTWTLYYTLNGTPYLGAWYYNHSYDIQSCNWRGTHYYGYTQLNG